MYPQSRLRQGPCRDKWRRLAILREARGGMAGSSKFNGMPRLNSHTNVSVAPPVMGHPPSMRPVLPNRLDLSRSERLLVPGEACACHI
jgi:hypothetical protein